MGKTEAQASTDDEQSINFDVATAIALAGCAFESYNEPVGVVEGYQEWSINGTYTTYVDRWITLLISVLIRACAYRFAGSQSHAQTICRCQLPDAKRLRFAGTS